MKQQRLHVRARASETRAAAAIARYIDNFYSPIRRHSGLNFTSPAQFEKMAAT